MGSRGQGDAIDGHREGRVGAPAHFDQVVILKGEFDVSPKVAGCALAALAKTAVYIQGEVTAGFGDYIDGMTGKVKGEFRRHELLSKTSGRLGTPAPFIVVGVTGLEPATPASRRRCSTRLSYTPRGRECMRSLRQ